MTTAIPRAICAFVLSLAAVCGAQAQSQGVPGDIKNFVTQYVAATNAKDAARLRSFFLAQSLACETPATKDYYDTMFAQSLDTSVPAKYTFSLLPVHEGNLKALESMGQQWTVKPQNELHIDYQQGDDAGTVIVYLVQQNGRWFDDLPCATDAAIKQYRDNAAANKAALAHYKAMADGIKEPLRSELLGLLRAHETGRAIDRYREASGQDGRTSMLVINALKDDAR